MLSTTTSPQTTGTGTAKPGTACLGCRRRKLKCSREEDGCANCARAVLPCVYPAPQTGEKRKRGPYRKDKPARERHLEDLVKYLEPKAKAAPERGNDGNGAGSGGGGGTGGGSVADDEVGQVSTVKSSIDVARRTSNSEDLVKDALIALTKSHVTEQQQAVESTTLSTHVPTNPVPSSAGGFTGQHPPPRRILEYWHLYVSRVDPLLKIIHAPSFATTLFSVIDNLETAGPVTEALLFSIYHISVSTCTPREARRRFGEDRSALLKRYGRIVEGTLADNYGMPTLGSLQALVTYILAIRREDSLASVKALFSLAVRMAQLIGLHNDPDSIPNNSINPFESEMRRRAWWHICGLESRGAEEGSVRRTSIQDNTHVPFPSNLNDMDLDPETKDKPVPRTGITDMTWLLVRSDIVRLVHGLKSAQRDNPGDTPAALKAKQRKIFEETQTLFETTYLRHLHPSRPYDWLCTAWIEGMLIKCRLLIDHPMTQTPSPSMPAKDRFSLLHSSVSIIRLGHACSTYRATAQWSWFFRGYIQWHSIAVVVAELATSTNVAFVKNAWAVLDPILEGWDKVYAARREEPAWEYVDGMIGRARERRREMMRGKGDGVDARGEMVGDGPGGTASYGSAYPGLATVASGALPGIWGPDWGIGDAAGMGGSGAVPDGMQQMGVAQFGLDPMASNAMTYRMEAAPAVPGMDFGFDYNNFSYDGGLDNIDFSAFEGVFGDTTWDFSPPSTDFTLDSMPS